MSAIALTFDDGPDPAQTPRLLDLLAESRSRATFFPIAPRAAAQPQLIRRMIDEGHAVGVHCDRHVRHSSRDLAWGRRDASRALRTLRELGCDPRLWRTPWGDTAEWSGQVATEHGLAIVGWTVDTHDWRGDSAPAMYAATRPGLRAGAIVLAHDGLGPGARRSDSEQTLAFVELMIEHAQRSGLRLEALT